MHPATADPSTSTMSRILIPARSAEDWRTLLARESQWRTGYSARSLAYCWHAGQGFPPSVSAVLQTVPEIGRAQMLLGIPEHRVALPGGGRQSQTDLWVLARGVSGLVSIAVEGKVRESFGPTIEHWMADASSGKCARLRFLCDMLGLPPEPPSELRYQLLHRTAAAVIEALRFSATHAVMLVHSFSSTDDGFEDFERFAAALGAKAMKGRLCEVARSAAPVLYLGWARGEREFLSA